jgi:hypothetical protein
VTSARGTSEAHEKRLHIARQRAQRIGAKPRIPAALAGGTCAAHPAAPIGSARTPRAHGGTLAPPRGCADLIGLAISTTAPAAVAATDLANAIRDTLTLAARRAAEPRATGPAGTPAPVRSTGPPGTGRFTLTAPIDARATLADPTCATTPIRPAILALAVGLAHAPSARADEPVRAGATAPAAPVRSARLPAAVGYTDTLTRGAAGPRTAGPAAPAAAVAAAGPPRAIGHADTLPCDILAKKRLSADPAGAPTPVVTAGPPLAIRRANASPGDTHVARSAPATRAAAPIIPAGFSDAIRDAICHTAPRTRPTLEIARAGPAAPAAAIGPAIPPLTIGHTRTATLGQTGLTERTAPAGPAAAIIAAGTPLAVRHTATLPAAIAILRRSAGPAGAATTIEPTGAPVARRNAEAQAHLAEALSAATPAAPAAPVLAAIAPLAIWQTLTLPVETAHGARETVSA